MLPRQASKKSEKQHECYRENLQLMRKFKILKQPKGGIMKKWLIGIGLSAALVACPTPTSTSARVRLNINWGVSATIQPMAIPSTAQSLRVSANGVSNSTIINKPTSSLELDVPLGTVNFVADAFSGTNATGTLLASTNKTQSIEAGIDQTVNLSFANGAGVQRISLSLSKTDLAIGASSQATAQAFDTNSAVLSGIQITYASSNPNVAIINATGLIQALTVGSTIITIQEPNTGKSASLTLTVTKTTVVISGV
jgi:hypothetical protein